jgi:acetyl esterase/lipase
MLVQVGTDECLLDDSTRLAERASDAGTDVVLEVWDDMIHVWQAFFAMLPEGRDAIDAIAAFLRARLK